MAKLYDKNNQNRIYILQDEGTKSLVIRKETKQVYYLENSDIISFKERVKHLMLKLGKHKKNVE